jgi:ribosomal protein S18 acetylase RimI-like enzyme
MRRPADQAKLLFLALLRSSAALATRQSVAAEGTKLAAAAAATASRTTGVSPTAVTAADRLLDGHIALRVARRSDVPHIQQCNLATLPENYSATFYHNHMRQWPDLALVAEHVPSGCMMSRPTAADAVVGGSIHRMNGSPGAFGVRGSNGRYDPQEQIDEGLVGQDDGRRIIGYVLGKVEQNVYTSSRNNVNNNSDRPRNGILRTLPPSTVLDEDDERGLFEAMSASLRRETENLGHVTSLAVLKDYRRMGLAAELMEQLHYHMRNAYRADAVGLHVRVSNRAATRLYGDMLNYDVHDIIQHYYQDGEDAYFMRKDLNKEDSRQQVSISNDGTTYGRVSSRVRRGIGNFSAFRSRSRPLWEVGPEEFRLPRLVAELESSSRLVNVIDAPSVTSTVATEDDNMSDIEEEQQIMSGAV